MKFSIAFVMVLYTMVLLSNKGNFFYVYTILVDYFSIYFCDSLDLNFLLLTLKFLLFNINSIVIK